MPSYEEYKDQGDGALAIGELQEAVRLYRAAVTENPDYFDGWHALGMALMKLGDYPAAIEAGKKATEIDPNNQFGWTSLSLAYVRNNQISEAEAAGGKAKIISWGGKVKIDPKP
jgi:tetratricopeptide (TPR) repeat protein